MTKPTQKICVLLSGGLDSALLIQKALKENHAVYPLYVACGLLWEEREQQATQNLLQELSHPNLAPLKVVTYPLKKLFPKHWGFHTHEIPNAKSPDEDVYIPGRNLLLLTQSVLYSEAKDLQEIWLGTLKGNPFSDATKDFFATYAKAADLALKRKIKIQTPFANFYKDELIARYPGFPYELTLSCLQSQDGTHCGACNKCEERRHYFAKANIADPTRYPTKLSS